MAIPTCTSSTTSGAIEVNAFQSHADVVVQKSIREGFGLTAPEASLQTWRCSARILATPAHWGRRLRGQLAQLAEQGPLKPKVAGSIPARPIFGIACKSASFGEIWTDFPRRKSPWVPLVGTKRRRKRAFWPPGDGPKASTARQEDASLEWPSTNQSTPHRWNPRVPDASVSSYPSDR